MLKAAAELASAYRAEMGEAFNAVQSGRRRGPSTGIPQLDAVFGGFLPPGVYQINGGAGTGKTALVNQIAANCCFPAQFVTTEMAPIELLRRHVARIHSTAKHLLLTGQLHPEREEAMLEEALSELEGLHYTDSVITAVDMRAIFFGQMVVQGLEDHSLLAVDSIHTWATKVADNGTSEYDAINIALQGFQSMALELRIPVILVAERNRASMKEAVISAAAGTRKLEYGPDVVLGLDVDLENSTPSTKRLKLKVVKNRFGPAGVNLELNFRADVMEFTPREVFFQAGVA